VPDSFVRSLLRALLVTLAFGMAGCSVFSPRALEDRPCGAHRTCSPEEALTAPVDVLRTNGSSLFIECEVERTFEQRHVDACWERVEPFLRRIRALPSLVSPADVDSLRVEPRQTCIDSFVSGNEGSDCAFFSYHLKIRLINVQSP
jgi:hypothetical protein